MGKRIRDLDATAGLTGTHKIAVDKTGLPEAEGVTLEELSAHLATALDESSALTAHIDDDSAAHAATAISYAGSAGLSATTVEAALDELDTRQTVEATAYGRVRAGRSLNINVLGDSTGNGTDEWVYKLAQTLMAAWPNHGIDYRLWDDASTAYGAVTTMRAAQTLAPVTIAGPVGATQQQVTLPTNSYTGSAAVTWPADPGSACSVRFVTHLVTSAGDYLWVEIYRSGASSSAFLYARMGGGAATLLSGANVLTGLTWSSTHTVTWDVTPDAITITAGSTTLTMPIPVAYQRALGANLEMGAIVSRGTASGVSISNITNTPRGPSIRVWNGSHPGAVASYSIDRLPLQQPVVPDLVIINYGHNEPGFDVTPGTLALVGAVRRMSGNPEIWLTKQNRRFDGTTETSSAAKNQSTEDLAKRLGLHCVKAEDALLVNPAWKTEYILGDSLHPAPAGSTVWAAEAAKGFTPAAPIVRAPALPAPSSIFVPASTFMAASGSPTLGIVSSVPTWSFDPATAQAVVATVQIPDGWATYSVVPLLMNTIASGLNSGNNVSMWEAFSGQAASDCELSPPNYTGVGRVPSLISAGSSQIGFVNATAYTVHSGRVGQRIVPRGRIQALQLRRNAADVLDTLASTVYLIGVFLERRS